VFVNQFPRHEDSATIRFGPVGAARRAARRPGGRTARIRPGPTTTYPRVGRDDVRRTPALVIVTHRRRAPTCARRAVVSPQATVAGQVTCRALLPPRGSRPRCFRGRRGAGQTYPARSCSSYCMQFLFCSGVWRQTVEERASILIGDSIQRPQFGRAVCLV
jgi:hypothetical protein